jgi:2-polyprenyl-3-methyl-5-hydroxy-6-metoxy-1,4-benzoquinol methylase
VIEHVSRPNEVWSLLSDLLLPGGLLAVMTKRVATSERFKNWHYKNDRTHICFYSEATFEWLSSQLELEYEVVGDDVVLFSKPNK